MTKALKHAISKLKELFGGRSGHQTREGNTTHKDTRVRTRRKTARGSTKQVQRLPKKAKVSRSNESPRTRKARTNKRVE